MNSNQLRSSAANVADKKEPIKMSLSVRHLTVDKQLVICKYTCSDISEC